MKEVEAIQARDRSPHFLIKAKSESVQHKSDYQ